MFDGSSEVDLDGAGETVVKGKKAKFNWKAMPVDDLIAYYDQIRHCLPPTELKAMNLEEEMLLQFHTLRSLQNEVLDDDKVPLNQRAQVANAVGAALHKLTERQADVYTQERFKAIENLLIRTLNRLPTDQAEAFLVEYEKILAAV